MERQIAESIKGKSLATFQNAWESSKGTINSYICMTPAARDYKTALGPGQLSNIYAAAALIHRDAVMAVQHVLKDPLDPYLTLSPKIKDTLNSIKWGCTELASTSSIEDPSFVHSVAMFLIGHEMMKETTTEDTKKGRGEKKKISSDDIPLIWSGSKLEPLTWELALKAREHPRKFPGVVESGRSTALYTFFNKVSQLYYYTYCYSNCKTLTVVQYQVYNLFPRWTRR